MREPDPREYLADPLSPIARAERRNLLLAATLAILIAHVNLVPTRMSALGLEFAPPAQASFLVVTALVVGYFMLAFATYALADLFVWRKRYYDYLAAMERESKDWTLADQIEYDVIHATRSADLGLRPPFDRRTATGVVAHLLVLRIEVPVHHLRSTAAVSGQPTDVALAGAVLHDTSHLRSRNRDHREIDLGLDLADACVRADACHMARGGVHGEDGTFEARRNEVAYHLVSEPTPLAPGADHRATAHDDPSAEAGGRFSRHFRAIAAPSVSRKWRGQDHALRWQAAVSWLRRRRRGP